MWLALIENHKVDQLMTNNKMLGNYSPLLTDFYQLTMAYGYWKLNMHDRQAVFNLLFRKNPFGGNYALSCGLSSVIEFLQNWHFGDDDLAYLATLTNNRGEPMFPDEFLAYLGKLKFSCSIDAIPEGTVVFPHIPILRIQGPLLQCQLLETPLLNLINFQTLVATKASRVCLAAKNEPVIEFGLRRAQGPDGALSASRAAYIGGCVATSNTLAGKLYDIPVRGTHAHSWVTAFDSEEKAFQSYAAVMPHNSVLLVDTYNTIEGIKHAIETGKELRKQGADLAAIRLDSGDMADLSIKARKLLDDAGFTETSIMSSNSLDEYVVKALKEKGAKVNSWGVGTNLVTAYDQPALDGVYKMTALQNEAGNWDYKIKLSEDEVKISNPGRLQTRRFYNKGQYVADVIYDVDKGIMSKPEITLLEHGTKTITIDNYDDAKDLMQPLFDKGKLLHKPHSIHDIRSAAMENFKSFSIYKDKSQYDVGLEKQVHELKRELMAKHRKDAVKQ